MKEGIVRITDTGKITDTELGREVIQLINKEKNKLKNCSSRYRKLMERHNNLIKRHSELRDNYGILKLKHNHVEDKYKSLTQVNKRLRKELKEKLIKTEWAEIEEREDKYGELQIYDEHNE